LSPFKPDPHFLGGVRKQKRIVSLVIDFNDGTREILEFADDNRAFYRATGRFDLTNEKVTRQYTTHEIWWTEDHNGID
jgi:hypothetical protein